MSIELVGIVGGGQMGSGIAEVCGRAGVRVVVAEADSAAADAARDRIVRSTGRAVDRGKMEPGDRDALLERLSFTADLEDLAGADLVVEAVIEDEAIKADLFARLDRLVVSRDAILASNTSSIPIIRIARATTRPGSVVGMHFFNPATVMPLVEIVHSVLSDDATVAGAAAFAGETLGKTVIHAGDRAGFVVNALLVPYVIDAIRMYESGFASKEDIDAGMVNGANHPMGPLALSDLIGNDTMLAVAESLYEEFREQRYAPPPVLRRMVEAGLFGRKSGHGFYDYA